MIHPANLHAFVGRDLEHLPDFDVLRHDHLDAAVAENRALATEAFERGPECCFGADGLQLQELAVGAPFLHEVTDRRDLSIPQDQHFIAGFFHVAEKMRGKQQADIAGLSDFANEFDQALARRRIHAVGWFVQDEDFGAMRNGLRELSQLFHAERIRSHRAITRFA